MLRTRSNVLIISLSLSFLALLCYVVQLPCSEAIYVAHRTTLLSFAFQALGESFPWNGWLSHPSFSSTKSGLHKPQNNSGESESRTTFTRHIIAVGDLHGDMENARRVLKFADVTDDKGDWSGNVDFFVQTGDIIDRGDDTIALFAWMDQLRQQASAVGGTVLSHLGNHEYMNAIGDWRYVWESEIKTFGSVQRRQEMISKGFIGRSWAHNYTVTSRLPLHPHIGPPNTPFPSSHQINLLNANGTGLKSSVYYNDAEPLSHAALSFVHGGLSPTYQDLTPFPTKINELGKSLLKKLQDREQPPPYPPNPYPGLPEGTTHNESQLYGTNGPLWYRGWAQDDEETVCSEVESVLARTGTRRMVMGHTPDLEKIVSRCGGKIIIIDTGITPAYGGVLSALSVQYTLEPIGEAEEKQWTEKEVITALYPDRQDVLVVSEREIVGDFNV